MSPQVMMIQTHLKKIIKYALWCILQIKQNTKIKNEEEKEDLEIIRDFVGNPDYYENDNINLLRISDDDDNSHIYIYIDIKKFLVH